MHLSYPVAVGWPCCPHKQENSYELMSYQPKLGGSALGHQLHRILSVVATTVRSIFQKVKQVYEAGMSGELEIIFMVCGESGLQTM